MTMMVRQTVINCDSVAARMRLPAGFHACKIAVTYRERNLVERSIMQYSRATLKRRSSNRVTRAVEN